MEIISRRQVLWTGLLGLGAGVAGAHGLVLAEDAAPTSATDDLHDYKGFLKGFSSTDAVDEKSLTPTARQQEGPYFRAGAPFRGKVTPPLEPGRVLVVAGRVWGADTRKPINGAVIDVWQANAAGHYDMSHPDIPLDKSLFMLRSRLMCNEEGYYEFETVYPGQYGVGGDRKRPSHIHYMVRVPGYKELITQLYFTGDPWIAKEEGIDPGLVKTPQKFKRGDSSYEVTQFEVVQFDIVLRPATA